MKERIYIQKKKVPDYSDASFLELSTEQLPTGKVVLETNGNIDDFHTQYKDRNNL